MRRVKVRHVALALVAVALAAPAAGTTKATANEGTLNMIAWEGYLDAKWVKPFVKQTGCKVNAKYAGSSDEMVTLMRSGGGGQYDMVSASGDASLRLIYGGDVAAVDVNRVPGWKQFFRGFQSPPNNTVKGKHYGISLQWGPNTLIWNTTKVKPAPTSASALYSPRFKGKITVPNNPIQIADAALYLMKTRPALGIKDPYELTKPQFDATIALLKKQRPLVKKYWGLASDRSACSRTVMRRSAPGGRTRRACCGTRKSRCGRSSRRRAPRAGSTRGCCRPRRSTRTARTPGTRTSRPRGCRLCRRSPGVRRR